MFSEMERWNDGILDRAQGKSEKEFLVLIGAHHRDLVRLGVRDWNSGIMKQWNDGLSLE